MKYVDRVLYWFVTRTPKEKLALLAVVLLVVGFMGVVFLSTLLAIFSEITVANQSEQLLTALIAHSQFS